MLEIDRRYYMRNKNTQKSNEPWRILSTAQWDGFDLIFLTFTAITYANCLNAHDNNLNI